MSKTTESLGSRLRRLRSAAGLSAFQLGARCRPPVDPNSLYDYENGRSIPTIHRLGILARAHGLTVAELIEGTDVA